MCEMTSQNTTTTTTTTTTSSSTSNPSSSTSNPSSSTAYHNAEDSLTAADFLLQQKLQQREARRQYPGNTSVCSYPLGPIRQQVFVCESRDNCGNYNSSSNSNSSSNASASGDSSIANGTETAAGVCYACMVSCHTRCSSVVDIGFKRNFICDCGTGRLGENQECCLLENKPRTVDNGNSYNQNYSLKYCYCHDIYDGEVDSMVQCWWCEDWFHDRCITNILATPLPFQLEDMVDGAIGTIDHHPGDQSSGMNNNSNKSPSPSAAAAAATTTTSGSYEHFVCKSCVEEHGVCFLNAYNGRADKFLFVDTINHNSNKKGGGDESELILDNVEEDGRKLEETLNPPSTPLSNKRKVVDVVDSTSSTRSTSNETSAPTSSSIIFKTPAPIVKKQKINSSSNGTSGSLMKDMVCPVKVWLSSPDSSTPTVPSQLFLLKGWSTQLCRCDSCSDIYTASRLSFLESAAKSNTVKCGGGGDATPSASSSSFSYRSATIIASTPLFNNKSKIPIPSPSTVTTVEGEQTFAPQTIPLQSPSSSTSVTTTRATKNNNSNINTTSAGVQDEGDDDEEEEESIESVISNELEGVDRQVALDGLRAYDAMKVELMAFLGGFARDGRVVGKEDVEAWFEERMAAREAEKRRLYG